MVEENVEETTQKQEEEETSGTQTQETSNEEQETSQPPAVSKEEFEGLKKKNEQLFARLKKTEEKLDKASKTQTGTGLDPEEVVKTMATFEGLDNAERLRLIQESKIKGISLDDARKDEDFGLWQQAHKKKVEKEKVIPPSTKQGSDTTSPKARVERFRSGQMTPQEENEFLVDSGIMKDYSRKKPA